MRFFPLAVETVRMTVVDLFRRPVATGFALAAMTSAVFVLASFLIVSNGARALLQGWSDEAVVEIYLASELEEPAIQALERQLADDPAVERVVRVSAERAMDEFREAYPALAGVEDVLEDNPFPVSLRLFPSDTKRDQLDQLVARSQERAEVSGVRYDREWLDKIASAGTGLSWLIGITVAVLLVAALVTIGSVVRLALEDKREEVRLMRLVGAPTLVVAAPVLLSGAMLGIVGALIAVVTASIGCSWLAGGAGIPSWIGSLFDRGLPSGAALGLIALGTLVGAVSAALSAGRQAFR